MRRAISLLVTAAILIMITAPAEARHPHCWGGGYGGFGGGFYSNTCYAGFNSPFVYGNYGYGNCNYGYGNCGYGYVPYRGCYYPGSYYGGYPAYNTFYYNAYPYGYGVVGNGPIFAPAQAIYGPAAVRNFLGMAAPIAPAPAAVKSTAVVVKKFTEPRKVREASPEYRRKSDQFIAQGDMLFREQKYQQAVDRYKSAAEMAPDSAEAYWHKGHAYAATNRYELAASCFRRALTLNPDIARGGFSLDKLYGDTRMAKEAHLEAIAGYCLEHPDTADAYFVLGIFLHYNGEADRAEKFFARAAELAGSDATYLARFVPGVVPVKADELEL